MTRLLTPVLAPLALALAAPAQQIEMFPPGPFVAHCPHHRVLQRAAAYGGQHVMANGYS